MSSELIRNLWDWWNALEPEFKFLMCLPFVVPAIAALGEVCRHALSTLRRSLRAPSRAARPTTEPATRAR